jgi:UDP-N-acetylmuramate--alanine ligase
MNIKNLNSVYFVGVGGIGMSALARYFKAIGKIVGGYDKTKSSLTDQLAKEGVFVHYDDVVASIPRIFLKEDTLIIYTPAIPKDSVILNHFQNGNFEVMKRSQVLGVITANTFAIAVAGTHGKTTTSSMIAHMLDKTGVGCNAFLGGIASNYDSNLILNAESKNSVVEADEYDRSFLTLAPNIAVVTSTDADHLDIYGGHDQLLQSFKDFVAKLSDDGVLVVRHGLDLDYNKKITYGFDAGADVKANNVSVANGNYVFNVITPNNVFENVQVGLPGRHNIENALATIAVAELMGVSKEQIIKTLAAFKGVKRRFERIITSDAITYIDDYAHHPKELEMCISSVKELYPNKKVTGIFQPHLFSRTRDFADGFAASLDLLDETILMDIYPARELPISGVTSEMLKERMHSGTIDIVAAKDIVENVKSRNIEVLLTLGAGDIDRLVEPLKLALS